MRRHCSDQLRGGEGCSGSTNSYTVNPAQALEDAIINAQANNHIIVAAAGNSSKNIDTHSKLSGKLSQDNIIAVAATDQNDQLAGFFQLWCGQCGYRCSRCQHLEHDSPGCLAVLRSELRFQRWHFDGHADGCRGGGTAQKSGSGSPIPSDHQRAVRRLRQDRFPERKSVVGWQAQSEQCDTGTECRHDDYFPRFGGEDAGPSGAFMTLTKRGFPLNQQLDLDLFFDDPTEVIIPLLAGGSAISIPANQQQIVIPVDILDDTLLDGTQTVTFDLHYSGASIGLATLQVTDVEALTISVDPASIREDAGPGAGTVTVTRGNTDTLPPDTYAVVNNQLLQARLPGKSGQYPQYSLARRGTSSRTDVS